MQDKRMGMLMRRVFLLVMAVLLLLPGAVFAQDDDIPTLALMQTVSGALDDAAPEARWQFEAQSGQTVSVLVRATSGDLDPVVQLLDDGGRTIAEADDIAYPDSLDAALEAVEIPEDGVYTVLVSRFDGERGTTSGDFTLTLLPAYARPVYTDVFAEADSWTADGSELVTLDFADEALTLSVNASNALVWASPEEALTLPLRSYVQVEAAVQNDADYWEYGMILRQTSRTSFYLFAVSSRGDWAFLARTGASTWLQLQDWTTHPALSDPPEALTLGVAMDGGEFAFYVDGALLGTVTADVHNAPGAFALSAGTVDQQETLPVIRYDNLLVTEPLPPPAEPQSAETAEPLTSWEFEDSAPVIEELAAQGVIPEGGAQVMYVPESYTTISRAGMQVLPLGRGRAQTDFVLATTIFLDSEPGENACGLAFRWQGEDRYSLFFLDALGGYGVAEWEVDQFAPAFYADDGPDTADLDGERVILVARGDRLTVYLNGEAAVVWPNTPVEGGIGVVSLSYDDAYVNCRFQDTWLWSWE